MLFRLKLISFQHLDICPCLYRAADSFQNDARDNEVWDAFNQDCCFLYYHKSAGITQQGHLDLWEDTWAFPDINLEVKFLHFDKMMYQSHDTLVNNVKGLNSVDGS